MADVVQISFTNWSDSKNG